MIGLPLSKEEIQKKGKLWRKIMKEKDKLVFNQIKEEMRAVYLNDNRPWMIGFSGGKDSTLLCSLLFEMLETLPKDYKYKKIYIVSSDTMVENPIVKKYMHRISKQIGEEGFQYNIISKIIYPEFKNTFFSKVIGLGYPTPEAPGFRWCTDRLKIKPMNKFTYDVIGNDGEVVLLLGVRKDESIYRSNNIRNREIEGKLLVPHSDIEKAFIYNPLTEIKNEIVWEYLLQDEGISPWKSSNVELFRLYQGENLGEEASVIGNIDDSKIPITGNSRFGCWICTMVKEDKSLKRFIDEGSTELIPLRDYRNWLMELRKNPDKRERKRRNGAIYLNKDGKLGLGPFTIEARMEMLKKLLTLEEEVGEELISTEELRMIDKIWEEEGDISRRNLVDIYYDVKGERLPWDEYRKPLYDHDTIELMKQECEKIDFSFELLTKLIVKIEENKNYTRSNKISKSFDSIMKQGWLHHEEIEKGL